MNKAKCVKRASRNFFADVDTRTKVVRNKKAYRRKEKHKKKYF
jgi:hypothetical protein